MFPLKIYFGTPLIVKALIFTNANESVQRLLVPCTLLHAGK